MEGGVVPILSPTSSVPFQFRKVLAGTYSVLTPGLTPGFRCLLQVRTYSLPTLMGVGTWYLLPISGIGIGLGRSEPLASQAGFAIWLHSNPLCTEEVAHGLF